MESAKFRSLRNYGSRQPGFTLVELTVVLVIISIMATVGMGALSAFLISANYSATKKKQEIIKDALVAFFGANKRLPCPDISNNTNGTADSSKITGQEDRAATGTCIGNLGVLPYAVLGLSNEAAEDGWGNLFTYRVYADSAPPPCPGVGKDWTNSACYGAGKVGGIILDVGTDAVPDARPENRQLVAALISHGSNGFGAWGRLGTRNSLPTACEESRNSGNSSGCTAGTAETLYKGEHGEENGNDDVVATLSPGDLFLPLAKQGVLRSSSSQVIEDLQTLLVASATDCTELTTDPPAPLDPWGKPYKAMGTALYPSCYCASGGVAYPMTCPGTSPLCQGNMKVTISGYRSKNGLGACP